MPRQSELNYKPQPSVAPWQISAENRERVTSYSLKLTTRAIALELFNPQMRARVLDPLISLGITLPYACAKSTAQTLSRVSQRQWY